MALLLSTASPAFLVAIPAILALPTALMPALNPVSGFSEVTEPFHITFSAMETLPLAPSATQSNMEPGDLAHSVISL